MDYLEKLDHELLDETHFPDIQQTIERFLKHAVSEKKSDGVVFGLSGGIDSVISCILGCKNIWKKSASISHARVYSVAIE